MVLATARREEGVWKRFGQRSLARQTALLPRGLRGCEGFTGLPWTVSEGTLRI
jgi:hypothetical protein